MKVWNDCEFIDSHTEGEPTRVITSGYPALGDGSLSDRAAILDRQLRDFCTASLCEPRGSEAIVGALLVEPDPESGCKFGVIFYNPAGALGMCGHGSIGLRKTLDYLGLTNHPILKVQTPVGVVEMESLDDGKIAIQNVESWVFQSGVSVSVEGFGEVVGDVSYGGNWFFLTSATPTPLERNFIPELTAFTISLRKALSAQGITGENGEEIDHVELYGASSTPGIGARNFVMCPGGAYDRSPCGTGTSAKLACLAAKGQLAEGDVWRQESILGGVFDGSYKLGTNGILPTIAGRAWITARGTLLFQESDPLMNGFVVDPFAK